ncbi:MAG: diaminopimelate epimerase, partial [Methanomicrobiales archaeon]|nr:diaminopimelate epimerase [Methanomicrobiales archaeon]
MEISFVKLQGNGNDFVLIDEYAGVVIPDEMKAAFARLYCDRRFGIGADGILFLSKPEKNDIKMRLFQPDESEAEMCGNGIRCLVKYAHDAGYVGEHCTVETLAGEISVTLGYREEVFYATITMPEPAFDRPSIPASGDGEYLETIGGYEVYAANTGVPHAVVFVEEIGDVEIGRIGPIIRNHPTFPEGANVNFVEVVNENEIRIRTFERGVEGETFSCGTGATASAAVAHRLGYAGEPEKKYVGTKVQVITRGGPLTIYLDKETLMEGPAETVFEGVIL